MFVAVEGEGWHKRTHYSITTRNGTHKHKRQLDNETNYALTHLRLNIYKASHYAAGL